MARQHGRPPGSLRASHLASLIALVVFFSFQLLKLGLVHGPQKVRELSSSLLPYAPTVRWSDYLKNTMHKKLYQLLVTHKVP